MIMPQADWTRLSSSEFWKNGQAGGMGHGHDINIKGSQFSSFIAVVLLLLASFAGN